MYNTISYAAQQDKDRTTCDYLSRTFQVSLRHVDIVQARRQRRRSSGNVEEQAKHGYVFLEQ